MAHQFTSFPTFNQIVILLFVTKFLCSAYCEADCTGNCDCNSNKLTHNGLCLSNGSTYCCTALIGDSCSRNSTIGKKPADVSLEKSSLSVDEKRGLICIQNLHFKNTDDILSTLKGLKFEVELDNRTKPFYQPFHRVSEFIFESGLKEEQMSEALQSFVFCMHTSYDGKLSDITSDSNVDVYILMSTIPPIWNKESFSHPGNPIQLSTMQRRELNYEGCRLNEFHINRSTSHTSSPIKSVADGFEQSKDIQPLDSIDWIFLLNMLLLMILSASVTVFAYRCVRNYCYSRGQRNMVETTDNVIMVKLVNGGDCLKQQRQQNTSFEPSDTMTVVKPCEGITDSLIPCYISPIVESHC